MMDNELLRTRAYQMKRYAVMLLCCASTLSSISTIVLVCIFGQQISQRVEGLADGGGGGQDGEIPEQHAVHLQMVKRWLIAVTITCCLLATLYNVVGFFGAWCENWCLSCTYAVMLGLILFFDLLQVIILYYNLVNFAITMVCMAVHGLFLHDLGRLLKQQRNG